MQNQSIAWARNCATTAIRFLKSAGMVVLLTAVFTDTVDLEGVAGCQVMIFAANLLLEFADFLGEEFDGTPATGADHVVMAAPVVLVFVTRNAVVEGDLAGQAALGQQLQRAVDGSKPDASVFFLDQAVKFVGGKMIAGLDKSAQDGIALCRLFQPDALQVAMKDLLGFADHLARDGGLIIDALLKHGERNGVRIPPGILKMKFVFSAPRPFALWNTIRDSS